MRLYNTLTKQVEDFKPYEEGKVKIYTCGPTVYHYAHIGNLRTYIFEDILEKGFRYLGYEVKRVMNITDVGHLESDGDSGEDKMEKSAKEAGKSIYEIAEYYTDAFFKDAEKLNIRTPEIVEKASDHIEQYIKMISKLIEDDYAYVSNGNVYFDISKYPKYYELSGKNQEDLLVGVRDGVEEDRNKRHPNDFALWFTDSKYKNQEMKWDSPWGVGYPGWHIECSGIAAKYLGEYLDIHCGGVDNVFPHHTNEIAQSEAFFGHKWCNFWIHGEHLNDKEGKMSKSKGDTLTVSVLEKEGFNPLSYRYFCLNSHYRNQLVFSFDQLAQAENAYLKLKNRIKLLDRTPNLKEGKIDFYKNKFKDSIANDLNTSLMLTLVYDVLKDDEVNDFTKLYLIEDFDKVLSLNLIEDEKALDSHDEAKILALIAERDKAKLEKDYDRADAIRDELLELGIKLIDGRESTKYEIL